MRKTITLKLTPELRARLEKYCQINDRSASWVIKDIITDRFCSESCPDAKIFKGVSDKLTISIPIEVSDMLDHLLAFNEQKQQHFLRTGIYNLTKGRKYK